MIDFLFIGPQSAGKTCIMNALQEKKIPDEHIQTKIETGGRGFFCTTYLREIGGLYQSGSKILEEIKNGKNICLVFNGIKMLEEMKNWKDGGTTTSFLTHWYRIAQEKAEGNEKIKLWFIATYKDQYKGKDLVTDIINATCSANEEYKKIAGASSKRYIFHDALNGGLFAINAMESKEVIDVYHKIKNK